MIANEDSTIKPAMGRFDTIDLLRGWSIVAVVLLHIYIRFLLNGFHVAQGLPKWLARLVFLNGGNGVTVFFAVSGFLITMTSIKRFGSLAEMRARVFYRIRFARIGPPLLLLLAVLSVLHLLHVEDYVIHKPHASLGGAVLSALTFTLNWYEAAHMKSFLPACWTVLWSLSIEEMFYLFFPVCCLLLLRFRRGVPMFVMVLLGFIVAGCFARTVWNAGDDLATENSYLAGMAHIAMGVLAALFTDALAHRKALPGWVSLALQVMGTALILLFAFSPRWHWMRPLGRSGLDDLLLALGAALVMIGSVLRRRAGSWLSAPVRWFGRHSYEIYLTHEFLVLAGVNHFLKVQVSRPPGPMLVWTAGILLATAPVGFVVARYFSEPMNRRLRGPRAA